MTVEMKAQKSLILFGGGSNGKGVFTEILSALVGKANVVNDDDRIDNKTVYSSFKTWAKENGYKSHSGISNKAFWREFEAEAKRRDITTLAKRSNAFRFHTGIQLVKEFE